MEAIRVSNCLSGCRDPLHHKHTHTHTLYSERPAWVFSKSQVTLKSCVTYENLQEFIFIIKWIKHRISKLMHILLVNMEG